MRKTEKGPRVSRGDVAKTSSHFFLLTVLPSNPIFAAPKLTNA